MQRTMIRRPANSDSISFNGSEQDFENLFRTLFAPLARYAKMYISDPDEAKDIVQQVFVKMWQQKEKLQVESVKGYLYRSVYHECINRARHATVKGTYMEQNLREMEQGSTFANHAAEGKELEKRIGKALEELPEQCGKAFKLSRFHHLSYAEIAEVMQISVKTVENHMGKALSLMRTKLADYLVIIFILSTCLF
jgi:RNA polymerase sigma-70 factor (ECF subfamily)